MNNSEFLTEHFSYLIPVVFLYAELHFRFKWSGSRYFQKEPEILSDLPIRIEPNKDIPILLIIKDSHLFPIHLNYVEITIYKSSEVIYSRSFDYNIELNVNWWEDMINIKSEGISEHIEVNVEYFYMINGINKRCTIHNYPLSTNNRLNTYVSSHNYPNNGKVLYGDIHYHSNLTEDMVEFGASLNSTLIMSESLGLDFFCNTDHSYDLDDEPGSWTKTDPSLKKWNDSRVEIDKLNNENNRSSFIIPSEELSLHNQDGRNVHALILNNSKFLPGSGDGAEIPFDFNADYNTESVHYSLDNNSICIAAHPFNPVPLVQWFFVKRGKWEFKDIIKDGVAGLQIMNGAIDSGFNKGLEIWKKLLLKGYRKYIYAGNDAHGNFNIYRQIKTPMISLYEKKEQLFGEYRTGVFVDDNNSKIDAVITSMKIGNCFVTNGPLINLKFEVDDSTYCMGSTIQSSYGYLIISILSTPEFGNIKKLIIKKGNIGESKEIDYLTILNPNCFELIKNYEIYIESNCYFRCEAEFVPTREKNSIAFSNPIWLKHEVN